MFSLCDLCFMLCSRDLDVLLHVQRIMVFFILITHKSMSSKKSVHIDPIHKGVSLFLSHTNMNKMNSLHHMKEHPKISNFLQFESHSRKCFRVRAISDLRNLCRNMIQRLTSLAFMFYILFKLQ